MKISDFRTVQGFDMAATISEQCREGTWVGRAWLPEGYAVGRLAGPYVIKVKNDLVYDISGRFATMVDVLNCNNPAQTVSKTMGAEICGLHDLLRGSFFPLLTDDPGKYKHPCLLSPNDLQAVKACGVTFAQSLIERIIEERAQGDQTLASEIRETMVKLIGNDLSDIKPGSIAANELKKYLIKESLWSQYLEVGIGKDAEIFTKCLPLSSVTSGQQIGVMRSSSWNNPEPEIVTAVNRQGSIIGASLGNDVNHRDYEGRSALLLSKAKDQNATCSIGPFIRLFDDTFSRDDIMQCSVSLEIHGEDGFRTMGENRVSQITRTPEELVAQTLNLEHQYPDGLMLFLGTMFAPTQDREAKGDGFTHKPGDRVEISTPQLGKLVNWVNYCDEIPSWQYGLNDFMKFSRSFSQ